MKTQSVPYTTGNELLAYQGNAALAAGANNGITPQSSDPFAGVGNTIDQVNEHLAQRALLEYKQKQKDNEDVANVLSATGGSVFNMKGPNGQNVSYTPLPDDQKILEQNAHDLRATILANPDNYMYDQKYLDKKAAYDQLVNHAGVRAKAYTDYNLDAAKETDPDEQKSILAQRNSEIGGHTLNEFHMPEPHLPGITPGGPEDFIDKEAKNPKNWQLISDDGKVETNIVPNQFITDPRNLTPGSPLYIKALKLGQKYLNAPVSQDPQNAQVMNAAIDNYNTSRGLKDGDPNYMAPLYKLDPATGKISFNDPNPNRIPLDIAAALVVQRYGQPMRSQKSAEDIQKIEDEKAKQILERQKEAETHRHNVATENKEKQTAESLKEEQDKIAGEGAYKEAHAVFNAPYTKPVSISSVPAMVAATSVRNDGYTLYEVPNNVNVDKFVGVPAEATTTKTASKDDKGNPIDVTTTTTPKGQSTKADNVYMAINPAGDKKLVYVKGGAVINEVPERDAISNSLKHESKYDEKVYSNRAVWGQHYYDNGGAPTGPPPSRGQQATTQPATAPVRKTIGTDTYEKGADGQWYKL